MPAALAIKCDCEALLVGDASALYVVDTHRPLDDLMQD
jgi:hypothetical protein